MIKSIGSKLIESIENGPLLNICLDNRPPTLKGKTYKEIYGDRYQEEIDKRRKTQMERGWGFGGRKHTEESKNKISQATSGENNAMWGTKRSKETRDKISKKAKERLKHNHPSWKVYEIISPDGEVHIVDNGVKKFCEKNNLSYNTLIKTLRTKKPTNSGKNKGWKIKELTK